MTIAHPVPALGDNYIWVLSRDGSDDAIIVDPGDAEPVEAYLSHHQLRPAAVLLTHHHYDHVGGAEEIKQRFECPVYGPGREVISAVDHPVREGDSVVVESLDLNLTVLDVPGHTAGHVAYLGKEMVFCGDTLFVGGCGRIFEGTPAQMYHSLGRLAAMAPETRVFCAHEYTVANLVFAFAVEPENRRLSDRLKACRQTRKDRQPTVPSTIAEELRTNPFLRCSTPEVVTAACEHTGRDLSPGCEVFTAIRAWKDSF